MGSLHDDRANGAGHLQYQQELPLPFGDREPDQPLIPARMVNEYHYCPRLAYMEWVQGEWSDSSDTVEGRHAHRRVDQPGGDLPAADDATPEERIHARSVTLSSERLGLIARMDLIEGEGNVLTPVDYKRGKRPHVARGAYEPERVQLCVQCLILEDNGYQCHEGILYFQQSRERVRVVFDEELRSTALGAINGLRLIASGGRIPPPLEDSPKCPRCSLVTICLPDEVNFLRKPATVPRRLAVGRDEALPLYIQEFRAKLTKKGDTLEVMVEDETLATARLIDVSQVVLMGSVQVTAACLHELMRREIPVTWHTFGGWFIGHTQGVGHKNIELRIAQFRKSTDPQSCLRLARGWVRAKVLNSRTLLRRNWRGEEPPASAVSELKRLADQASRADSLETLLGIEGAAASVYFGQFAGLIRQNENDSTLAFNFLRRNRRPPEDPVNALLSFAYALLVRTWTVTLSAVGLDPYCGYYHQPRYGRPALALDMMEPFRPLIADSTVLTAINNNEVKPSDFIRVGNSVNLSADGRKRFIAAFERRMNQEVTHPIFGYTISYRRLLEVQARLLGRFLLDEIAEYPNFTTR